MEDFYFDHDQNCFVLNSIQKERNHQSTELRQSTSSAIRSTTDFTSHSTNMNSSSSSSTSIEARINIENTTTSTENTTVATSVHSTESSLIRSDVNSNTENTISANSLNRTSSKIVINQKNKVKTSQSFKHQPKFQKQQYLVELLTENKNQNCSICLTKETNHRTLCQHPICRNCAEKWNKRCHNKFYCPTCRLTASDLLNAEKKVLKK